MSTLRPLSVIPSPSDELEQSDDRLMLLAVAGDRSAFCSLVQRHQAQVRRLCGVLLKDEHLSRDAAQVVFLHLWQSRAGYHAQGKLKQLLFMIARNHCRSLLRRRRLGRLLGLDTGASIDDQRDLGVAASELPEQALQHKQLACIVRSALARLPDRHRIPLQLRFDEELSYDEIAVIIQRNASTARSRVHYGLKKLAALLPPEVLT